MRSAFLYIRFSHPSQRKGDSLARQQREGRLWCERNNCILDESLNFMTERGHTAFDGSNLDEGGGLGLFLAAVKAGSVPKGSVLLVERLDRFSRTDVDIAFGFFGQVLRAGVNVVSMRSGTEYTLDMLKRQPTMIMGAVMEFILANEESVKKSERETSVWIAKREKARQRIPVTKRGPLWLRLLGTDGLNLRGNNGEKWEVVEDKADIVRRIFKMTADGIGGYRLAAILNKEGTPRLENRPHWTQKAVHRVLSNRAVLGEFQPQRLAAGKPVDEGPPVAGYYPRIITDELWFGAQAQTTVNRVGGRKGGGRAGKLFLFQKIAFDADTNSSLVVRSTRGGKKTGYIRYLIPSAALRGGRRITVPLDAFETTLLTGLGEIQPDDIMPPAGQIERDITDAKNHLRALRARIEETEKAMGGQPAELMGGIVAQVAAWKAEERDWTKYLDEMQSKAKNNGTHPLDELKTVAGLWKDGDETARAKIRALVRAVVKKITAVIRPGKDRYHKRLGVLVEFNGCPETRVFLFTVPSPDVAVVMAGWTMADLAKM